MLICSSSGSSYLPKSKPCTSTCSVVNHEPACEQGALEPHILLLYKVLRIVFHTCQLLVKALSFTDRARSTGEYSVHMAILPIVDELLSDSPQLMTEAEHATTCKLARWQVLQSIDWYISQKAGVDLLSHNNFDHL